MKKVGTGIQIIESLKKDVSFFRIACMVRFFPGGGIRMEAIVGIKASTIMDIMVTGTIAVIIASSMRICIPETFRRSKKVF